MPLSPDEIRAFDVARIIQGQQVAEPHIERALRNSEAEACAKIAEEWIHKPYGEITWRQACEIVAAAIRARIEARAKTPPDPA